MAWLFIRRDRALINLDHVAQVQVAESSRDVFKIIAVASDYGSGTVADSWEVLTDLSADQAMETLDQLAASLGARDNLILRGGGEGGAQRQRPPYHGGPGGWGGARHAESAEGV